MAGQPGGHAPWVEERTTAMRLERHRNRTGINLIQKSVEKAMLLDFIPAVAAGDQSDLERGQRHGPLQAALNLIKMLRWRAVEIGGVIAPGHNFENQMLFGIGETALDPFRLKSLKTRVIEVHLKTIKPVGLSGATGLFQGGGPAPESFEQQQPRAAQWISVNSCG